MTKAEQDDQLHSAVVRLVRREVHVSNGVEVEEATMLQEDLGVDSLLLIDLLGALENEFNIELSVDSVRRLKTVGDLERETRSAIGGRQSC